MHAYPILPQVYTHLHLKVLVAKHTFPVYIYIYIVGMQHYTLTTRSVCSNSLLSEDLVSVSSSKQEFIVIQVFYFANYRRATERVAH